MLEQVDFWKKHATTDLVDQINKMSKTELEDAFSKELHFGTAGIRSLIGPGPNRMNIYTVMRITYGFGKYLKQKYKDKERLGVIIGTDNRHQKEDFSRVAAGILTQMGIQVFKSLIVPTPLVSFTIRKMKVHGGIVITASHNPKEYNGYKIYDEKGSQILPEVANEITKLANEHKEYLTFPYKELRIAIPPIPNQVINLYHEELKKLTLQPIAKNKGSKIVFSPLHGTTSNHLPLILEQLGHEVIPVQEQMDHDPNFSKTASPNPEDPIAYELGLKYLGKYEADLLIAIDPDGDRLGVIAKYQEEWKILNGNQLAAIIFDYLLKHKKLKNNQGMLIHSYVSSDVCAKMARANKMQVFSVATGFKWIGALISKHLQKQLVFGFEESCGYLIDSQMSHDKDAMQAAVLVAEIAAKAKQKNQTLWDVLKSIYQQYGYHYETTTTMTFNGFDSLKQQEQFMINLRKKAKTLLKTKYVVQDLIKGHNDVAPMNLVKFIFAKGWIAIRPSGTEPKIKFYQSATGKDEKELIENRQIINAYAKEMQTFLTIEGK